METTFNTETFKRTFRSYLIMLGVTWGVLVFGGFGLTLVLEIIPYGRLVIGKVVSGIVAIGFVAIGNLNIGFLSSGLLSVGIFSFGATACGIIAIGPAAIGLLSVGMNAIGVVAIGYNTMGVYVLSYSAKSKGRYMFSPERQDAKAVALFTRWIPKLREAFVRER